jgi:hypothetical protein
MADYAFGSIRPTGYGLCERTFTHTVDIAPNVSAHAHVGICLAVEGKGHPNKKTARRRSLCNPEG